MSGEDSTSGNVVPVGVLADGSGWDVRINDQNNNFPATEQADWSFVYVPYNAQNMVAAGNLGMSPRNNSTGVPTGIDVFNAFGTFTASLVNYGNEATNGSIIPPPVGTDTDLDTGRFLITIPGKTDQTGYLMVGVSKLATTGTEPNLNIAADDNMLTWEYIAELGGFVVETMDLTGANLQNSDIYFAYFDYDNPITPVPEPGLLCIAAICLIGLAGQRRRTRA
jgi:hypothetical protein